MAAYFENLNYTLGDEDAQTEMDMLPEKCGHVLAVADCGSRILPLLARAPRKLTCIDINPGQLAIAALRIALLRDVDRDTYCRFLGYTDRMAPPARRRIFADLNLDGGQRSLLKTMLNRINWEPLVYEGRFERMLVTLSKVNRAILGRACDKIFEQVDVRAQAAYFCRQFPRLRWQIILTLLGNSKALNSLLYKGDFPEKNVPRSYRSIYTAIFERLLTQFPVRSNFFLQMVFLGKIRFEEALPIECHPEVYPLAQAGLAGCEVNFVTGDVMTQLGSTGGNIDFLSLSDVPSFLPDTAATSCLRTARPHMRKGGLIVIRGHVRLIEPDLLGFRDDSSNFADVISRETTGLWQIRTYRAV